jgi:Cys-tRNA(Pro)/Cys-tRNA(Cys) deacylase
MTPAINAARKAKIAHQVHEYDHNPASASYGGEAAEKLGLPEDRVFKTLVVAVGNEALVVGVVPVSAMLNMKALAKAVSAKKAAMANPLSVLREKFNPRNISQMHPVKFFARLDPN